jgi:hypothetical protein
MFAPGRPGFVIDETTFALRMNVLEVLKDGEDETEVNQLVGTENAANDSRVAAIPRVNTSA